MKIIDALFTTVLDRSITCTSACRFDLDTLRVLSVEMATNAEEPEVMDAVWISDIYVTLPDGTEIRHEDGLVDARPRFVRNVNWLPAPSVRQVSSALQRMIIAPELPLCQALMLNLMEGPRSEGRRKENRSIPRVVP